MNRSPLSTIIHPKHLFFSSVFGFFLSTGFTNHFGFSSLWILLAIILVALQIVLLFGHTRWYLVCFLVGILLGFSRTTLGLREIQENFSALREITHNFSLPVKIRGTIKSLSKIDAMSNTYILSISTISDRSVSAISLFLQSPLNVHLKEGDVIEYVSDINPLQASRTFSFDKYYFSKSLYGWSHGSQIRILDSSLSWYDRQIVTLRNTFSSHINGIYPPDTAALLGGLLFWTRQNLDDTIDIDFKLSGLSHIVAVSGFNITILIVFFASLLRFAPIWIRLSIITLIVWVFCSLVGEQVSALRAAVMWLVWYYAISLGKKTDIFSLLLGVAALFVLIRPLILNYDISFHLSFLAVLWMFLTADFFKKHLSFVPGIFGIRESLIATFGALSLTFPVVLLNFWQFPLLSPLANLLVTPFLPITMLFWFLSILFDMLFHTAGVWVSFLGWWLLRYLLFIAHFFAGLKNTILQIDLSVYGILFLSWYYLSIVYFIFLWSLSSYTSSKVAPSSWSFSWERINEA